MREREIERYLVASAELLGGEVRKVKWIGRRAAPDRLVMLPRMSVWVELKAPGKAATISQQREHMRMRAAGQRVVVLDSLSAVDKLFE